MGNRTARNTGIPGTGVEAIGKGVEKMSDDVHIYSFFMEGDETSHRYTGVHKKINATGAQWNVTGPLAKAMKAIENQAEARGYRRGVEDAAMVASSNFTNVAQFETTYNTLDKIRSAILALLEQTSDSNRPHPGNGTGLKSET
jgi:hypothetical protein